MNLPQEAPKLPLLPFLIGDAALITTAVFVGRTCATPISPWPLLAITVCVVLGAVLAATPFIVNYAKRQDAELTERQNQIAALARITAESAEQLSIAAASLHGIAEASSGNLKLMEQLPTQLQDHVNKLQKQLTDTAKSASSSTKDEAARIYAAAERITQAITDLTKLETSTRQHLAALNDALDLFSSQAEKAVAATRIAAQAEHAVLGQHAKSVTEAAPTTEATRSTETAPAPQVIEERTAPLEPLPTISDPIHTNRAPSDHALPAVPETEPSSVPSFPATKATLSALADPSLEKVPVSEPLKLHAPLYPKPTADDTEFDLGLAVEATENESAITSDSFTRLIVTAYIGIGNKLFIRGEGPGLSWDKGIALQFVSIGKWHWETAEATAPIRAKLYKNDQTECISVGTLTLKPGHQHEVNAGF